MNKIEVVNLSHFYQDGMQMKKVLDNISCSFESGKFYSILGQSGSGKTTLLSLLSGLDTIEEGDILYNGESIKKIGYNKYRNSYVNIIFQSYNLIPYMTAYENVEVALDITGIKLSKEDKKEKILSTLNELGIDNSAAFRTVLKLSGGEQQRVAIARCLVIDIPFIMADEPTGNLDEDTEKKIIDIFKKLAKQGKGVIVVTHSKELAESSDKIYHIKGGGVY
jgi:putative ABC transport system ATP-binding protein